MDGGSSAKSEAFAAPNGNRRERVVASSNVASSSITSVTSLHRRSKSASDRNCEKHGVSSFVGMEQNGSQLIGSTRRRGASNSSCKHYRKVIGNTPSSNQQASLENDIQQLQMRLQQEKSVRIMLERAIGRTSSTLSPGHRHFAAQTRELITEIESLEEEVANREQHVHENAPMMDKSNLGTLKDHLYQCPSKLSEDLVRCMAAIYCRLHCDALHFDASRNSETGCSPMMSRSSSGIVRPRHNNEDEPNNHNRFPLEISWISTRNELPSYVIGNYRSLVEQLEKADPSVMESALGVWDLSRVLEKDGPISQVQAAYNIGGHIISASSIEECVLFCRMPRTGRWFEGILSTAMRKRSGVEKQLICSRFGLSESQPLAFFALCSGALSDPVLKIYTSHHIREELEKAKREFLQANVVVKKSRKVSLPKLLDAYSKEASISSDDLLDWVSENVDKKLHCAIQACIDSKSKRRASQLIEWLPYNTRFSYVLAKDLAKKP
ncbi:hypothetical protein QJS04_geneDACA018457 [Acorus gramineus]|uniref:Uncharacterized protein n=1 Tax=Acorus gramineus TaxID=55184 RepID=A0AAV9ACX1_ACOGR|nr:hypothetical protein QJS04_geneDACA018457 [Acorus gramineus]